MPFVIRPMLKLMGGWERAVIEYPGQSGVAKTHPAEFNIIAKSLNVKDDHPPVPGFPRSVPFMMSSVRNIRKSVKELVLNPTNGKKEITPELLDELREFACSVGADEIGFTDVPQAWVFQETAICYAKAIVLVMEMDRDRMNLAPNQDTAVMVHQTYDALGQVANKIAAWLREYGYAAHAGHPLGGGLYPPMAQAAGLGWRGLDGLLITPQFGPRVRLAAVFTEIENLPVYEGDEHAWVEDYCATCRRCLHECPPAAIYESPIRHQNGLVTTIDYTKCFPYFLNYHGCSVCIKVCPFHISAYDKLKARFVRTPEAVPVP